MCGLLHIIMNFIIKNEAFRRHKITKGAQGIHASIPPMAKTVEDCCGNETS